MRSLAPALALLIPWLLLDPPLARALEPAVARARYSGEGEVLTAGTVFFLALPDELAPAAVGAAHSFDRSQLVSAPYVDFHLGHTGRRVGLSSRFYAPPGRPFSEPGATLRDDFVVFRLDSPPTGARLLAPADRLPEENERVRLLGIPLSLKRDEDDLFGRVRSVSAGRIEIDLDVPADLRGWGGAPVVTTGEEQVLGILQAAWPTESTLRVAATPMPVVLEVLRSPLGHGKGALFSAFADRPGPRATEAPHAGQPAPPTRTTRAERATAAPPAPASAPRRKSLLGKNIRSPEIPLWVEIEHPQEGAVIGNELGAFVAGRAIAPRGEYRELDVIVVIDTSGSTADPTGVDVNGNGVVGTARLGSMGKVLGLGDTDPGDSILAAEVAAARRLIRSLDPRSTRVGLVTFAGEIEDNGFFRRQRNPVVTEVPLTTDYEEVERALDRVIERGPRGSTNMAAGVNQATIELIGARGALSEAKPKAEKIVLFLTDGQPTLPYGPGNLKGNVREVLRAARLAAKANVRFFTFGIGEEALSGPIALVELATKTQGFFTPVRDPGDLMQVVEEVDFANLEELAIRNRTTGEVASTVLKNPDGTFSAFVPLRPGPNVIEVAARASDGVEASETVTVSYAPDAPELPVPRPLVAQRNRLMERRLVELKRARIEAERTQVEKTRKELELEIERERAEAEAERQRKELDLSVEDAD